MADPFKKASEVESSGTKFADFVDETVLIQPKKYEDGLTGKFTKGEIDGMVLGKLVRPKATSSEPNPAYDLEDPSEAEVDAARKFLAGDESEPPF